jgi:hypothetical protein
MKRVILVMYGLRAGMVSYIEDVDGRQEGVGVFVRPARSDMYKQGISISCNIE